MNLLKPRKVLSLTQEVPAKDFNDVTSKPTIRSISLLSKIGIFIRWSSYTITLALIAGSTYICYSGLPTFLRTVELQSIEAQITEFRQSLANVEDKLDVEKAMLDKLKLKK